MHGADRNAITAGPQPPNSRSRRRTAAAPLPVRDGPGATEALFFGTRNWNAPECSVPERSRQPGEETDRHPERRRTGRPADRNKTTVRRQTDGWRRREGGPGEETDRKYERRRIGGSLRDNSPAANRRVAEERRRTGKEAGSDDTRHTSPRRSPQRAYSDPGTRFGAADKIKFSTDTPVILQTINGRILKNVNYFYYFCINWKIMNLNAEVL